MDTDNGLLALLDDRAATYGLLARLLGLEVDAELLAARTAQALREGDEATAEELLARQAAFMDAHLLNWAPRFADAMARTARTDFYRGLARFLAGWLQEDRATLAELGAQGEGRA